MFQTAFKVFFLQVLRSPSKPSRTSGICPAILMTVARLAGSGSCWSYAGRWTAAMFWSRNCHPPASQPQPQQCILFVCPPPSLPWSDLHCSPAPRLQWPSTSTIALRGLFIWAGHWTVEKQTQTLLQSRPRGLILAQSVADENKPEPVTAHPAWGMEPGPCGECGWGQRRMRGHVERRHEALTTLHTEDVLLIKETAE